MRLLEVAAADLAGGNVCGNRQHRRAAALRVIKSVDQMQVARPAGASADRELAGELRLAGGRESRHLLVTDMHPVDPFPVAQRLGQAVEAVADHAVDPAYSSKLEGLDDLICDCCHGSDSFCMRRYGTT